MFSCTNPAQNELIQDQCIYMASGNPQWLSPDIILTSSTGRVDEAREGESNTVVLRARRKLQNPDGSVCTLPASVRFQLWVGLPSLSPPTASAVQVQDFTPYKSLSTSDFSVDPTLDPADPDRGNPNIVFGKVSASWTAQETFPNDPSDPNNPNDPNNPGRLRLHRCLIARCYPNNLNPPDAQFCVVEDPHVVQRNIAILAIPKGFRKLSFPIQTNGKNLDRFEAVTIRAIADRVPSTAVLNAILPSLKQVQEFRQIAQIAPERFALKVPERFSPVIRDQSRPEIITPINPGDIPIRDTWRYVFRDGANFGRFRDAVFAPNVVLQEAVAVRKFNTSLNISNLRSVSNVKVVPKPNFTPGLEKLVERAAPTFEADIKLPPQEVANFTFTADLPENSQTGDAHIFHVMHINENKQIIGGLTIVTVVVDSVYPELVDALNNQRNRLVRDGYFAIFGNQPGTSSREIAVCLRDLNYAFEPIVECCRQGSTQPLDQIIPGLKETFSSLGFPTNWFITFYQFIKQNHGLTDAFANIVNPYLDRAINLMS